MITYTYIIHKMLDTWVFTCYKPHLMVLTPPPPHTHTLLPCRFHMLASRLQLVTQSPHFSWQMKVWYTYKIMSVKNLYFSKWSIHTRLETPVSNKSLLNQGERMLVLMFSQLAGVGLWGRSFFYWWKLYVFNFDKKLNGGLEPCETSVLDQSWIRMILPN